MKKNAALLEKQSVKNFTFDNRYVCAPFEIAADMVEKGDVDFIALGRPILKQPNFVEGLIEKIKGQAE